VPPQSLAVSPPILVAAMDSTLPTTMPMRMAPGTLRAWSMKISSSVTQKNRTGQPDSCPVRPRVTGPPSPLPTKPAFTNPSSATNIPMPMVIACLSASGMAFMIISRRPVTTSRQMTTPYTTHIPMACGQVMFGTTWAVSAAETFRPAASASGTLPMKPISSVETAAASAVAVTTPACARVCFSTSGVERISGLSRRM